MSPSHKSVRDSWEEEPPWTFLSPPIDKHWEQILLFPDYKEKNYAIEVDITFVKGQVFDNLLYKQAGVILRYSGENRYYYAGLGGFSAKSFIGIVEEQKHGKLNWNRLASQGKQDEIGFNKRYRLRVECQGSKISLYVDGSNRLSVEEDTYPTGSWGFRTVRTQARFANVHVTDPSTPKAFVIMPFTTSLNFVYEVIKNVVDSERLECHRVDESGISTPIVDDIKRWLANADLVIADLTGKNPNVYYEVGFAHALGKKVILIAQSLEDLSFDVRFIRAFVYSTPEDLTQTLVRAIRETL